MRRIAQASTTPARAVVAGMVMAAIVVACHETSGPVGPAVPHVDPAKVSARVDRVAEACAKIASCAHGHDPARERDPSTCVDWWLVHVRPDAAFAQCIAAATDCAGIDSCARGRGDPVAAAYCRDHDGATSACDGTRLYTCSEDDPAESTSADCAPLRATCDDVKLTGGLITRGCVSSSLCPAGAPAARCDGPSAIVGCHDGMVERVACAPGVRCEEHRMADGTGSALCEPVGHAHCSDIGKTRCEGSRLVQCLPHGPFGEAREVDCAAFGLACESFAKGEGTASSGRCIVPGARECEPGSPRCDGEAVTFCAAGKRTRVSCGALGFGACDPDGRGLDASCRAKK